MQNSLQPYGTYYHITHPKNLKSIGKHGLRANTDGHIFLVDRYEVIHSPSLVRARVPLFIARNQVFLPQFAVLAVSWKGIRCKLIPDDVAEITARFQFIAQQPRIAPSYCRFKGIYNSDSPTDDEEISAFRKAIGWE